MKISSSYKNHLFSWITKFFFFFIVGGSYLYPLEFYYLFQIDGGINFFNQDKDKIIDRYYLDDLRNTVAPTLDIRTGVVWNHHWLTTMGYGFIRREDYDYRLHYFTYNQKVYEQRDIHNVQFHWGYFLFPYQHRFNLFFGNGSGWAFYRSILTTIDNYSTTSGSGLRQRNQLITFQLHQFIFSPVIKIYRNLRSGLGLGGDIYFGIQYTMLFPSKVNFPEILLGFDASIDFSYKKNNQRNTFTPQKQDIQGDTQKELEGSDKIEEDSEKPRFPVDIPDGRWERSDKIEEDSEKPPSQGEEDKISSPPAPTPVKTEENSNPEL